MKKILILAYDFPPYVSVGGLRPYSWAKYLHKFGYYPIIVTRNWGIPITGYKDMSVSTIGEMVHEVNDNYEVYYLPYKGNLRDKLYEKYGDKKMVLLRRMLSLFEIIFQNFSIRVLPYRNLYQFSDQLLKKDENIISIIASGKPYGLFHFCYVLAKKYKIPWIADYPDDWNTSPQCLSNIPSQDKWIIALEKRSEKKWLSNASCFLSISENYVNKIARFINKKGYVLMNGFDPDDYAHLNQINSLEKFVVLFSGTMYDTQPVQIFTNGFINFVDNLKDKSKVKALFLGLNFDNKQVFRIQKLLKGYEAFYEITDRFDKTKAIKMMAEASVFLMFSHNEVKGVTSSKIFDYLAIGKPIILCPSDHEILEELVISTHSGFVCNSSESVKNSLNTLYTEYLEKGHVKYRENKSFIKQFTRENQTKVLSTALNNIILGEIKNESLSEEKSNFRKISFNILNKQFLRSVIQQINNTKSVIRILCFHNISDKSDLSYPSLQPELFYDLIKYITKEYDVIPISELSKLSSKIKHPLILTFDDGYKDFLQYAFPILKEFNTPCINNIIVDCVETQTPFWTQQLNFDLSFIFRNYRKISFKWNEIQIENSITFSSPQITSFQIYKKLLLYNQNERNLFLKYLEDKFKIIHPLDWGLMNWNDINYCAEQGIDIGSHTMTHNSLLTIKNKEILQYEISESKSIIEKNINKSIETIAFPNGLFNNDCIKIATDVNYKYLLTSKEILFNRNTINKEFPLIIPRISINSNEKNENMLRIENFHSWLKQK